MEIDEEYIDKVKSLIEQKDAENVKTLLTDLHPADMQNCAMTSAWRKPASFTASLTTKRQRTYWLKWTKTSGKNSWNFFLRRPLPSVSWIIWTRTMP